MTSQRLPGDSGVGSSQQQASSVSWMQSWGGRGPPWLMLCRETDGPPKHRPLSKGSACYSCESLPLCHGPAAQPHRKAGALVISLPLLINEDPRSPEAPTHPPQLCFPRSCPDSLKTETAALVPGRVTTGGSLAKPLLPTQKHVTGLL